MFRLRQPTDAAIQTLLESQRRLELTYPQQGATREEPPLGYVVDRTRVRLGEGEHVFQQARRAISSWKQFELGWLKAVPANTPLRAGEVVAVVARTFGVWSLNAARIVYTIDEPARFGFAYGTLPGHAECGEERFLVELAADGGVWYDIVAFSRPRHVLARLGYPLVRRLQKRFGRESAAAMLRAVRDAIGAR